MRITKALPFEVVWWDMSVPSREYAARVALKAEARALEKILRTSTEVLAVEIRSEQVTS